MTLVCSLVFAHDLGASVQIPEGYEVVQIADDLGIHSRPSFNNNGVVVWSSSFINKDISDVFVYNNGRLEQVTGPRAYETDPVINNASLVAWERCEGFAAEQCLPTLYNDGKIEVVSTPVTITSSLVLNDAGHLVWSHDFSDNFTDVQLFLYDGTRVMQITKNGLSNQVPRMNALGQIVWVLVDLKTQGSTPKIMLWSQGETTQISTEEWVSAPDINDLGHIVWSSTAGVKFWDGINTTIISPDGFAPRINNKDEVAITRSDKETGNNVIWLYASGNLRQISDPALISAAAEINEHTELVWRAILPGFQNTGVFLMRRLPIAPTLSDHGLVLLGMLLAGSAVLVIYRLSPAWSTRQQ